VSVRYRIRKAAGSYWLLDMEQPGDNYIEPIELNESGARIWELARMVNPRSRFSPSSSSRISRMPSAEQYGIDMETVKEDVMQFLAGLEAVGVSIGVK